jgi:hypothetical protein
MLYFVFGLLRDNETVFIGRGNSHVNLQELLHAHNATGILYIAKGLTDLEALGLEYQLIHDVKPIDNQHHTAYSGPSPWTYPDMLYKTFGIVLPIHGSKELVHS